MDKYERALDHFQAGNWAGLGQELDIPPDWWDTISVGICQTDEFKKVIKRRRHPSVFKKLEKRLTTLSQHTSIPAPYTGDEAIEAFRHGELLSWKSIATVMLHDCMPSEEVESVKTYCWSLYQLEWPSPYSDKAAYAVALDPPFKTAWHLLQRKKTRELLDAFEIRQSWNVGGQLAQVFYHEHFRKVLMYMTRREVRGQHMYTKFSDVFSLMRGKERPLTSNIDSYQWIAVIILADGMEGDVYKVFLWILCRNTKSGQLLDDCGWVPVYRTALDLYIMQHWDGLRDLFDIDETWWDEHLVKIFKQQLFESVLKYMAEKEVRGQHMYTKLSDVFSLMRGPKRLGPQRAIEDIWQKIATIVLDHGRSGNSHMVHVWNLSWNTKTKRYRHECRWVNVYATAAYFHEVKHWAGLRGLFDIDESWWDKLLLRLCQQQSFGNVLNKLKQAEEAGDSIYPQFNNIFSWTRVPECKPEDVKVIIVGQDPVADSRATGMSFLLVKKGTGCPSIGNIFRSVKHNFEIEEGINHLCPYSWCQQGVLLLNTRMTIGECAHHTSIGWEKITTGILEYFIDCQKDRSLHILLWSSYWTRGNGGGQTGDKSPIEKLRKKVSGKRTRVIHNTHPSPKKGNQFFEETAIEKKLFKEEVTTVGWTTIRDGVPSIPAGVIHSTIEHGLSEQFARLPVGQ